MDASPTRRTARILGAGARTLGRSLLRRLPGGDRAQKQLDYWTEVGRDWAETLGDLRGAAMKLGQLASQYADVLPPPLAEQLKQLQRAVEPIPFAAFEQALTQRWTTAQRAEVRRIEPQALAAASIGQVHRAQLADGRATVIKLRYPGVEDAVDADLTQLRRVLSLSRLLPLDGPAMDRLMEEVRQRFRDETDYVTELGHLQYLREHAVTPGIVYPAPVEALCGPGVLVLSEEPGADLDTARHWPQAQRDALAQVLSRWLVHQLFVARAVHADPHPGNFAFRDDGRVVVYDFGCVKRVPAPVVQRVRQLIGAFARHDWPQVHQTLDDLGGFAGAVPLEAIEPLYKDLDRLLVRPLTASGGFDFCDADFIPSLRAAGRAHLGLSLKFKPVTDLVFVMRALSGHYWLLRALGARVDVRSLLLTVALEVPDGGP